MVTDKGYVTKSKNRQITKKQQSIRNYIDSQKAIYTIPPKANTKEPWDCDYYLYKERHLIECFFNKIKSFRRVATRYDKLASSFLAFVYIASIWILSK